MMQSSSTLTPDSVTVQPPNLNNHLGNGAAPGAQLNASNMNGQNASLQSQLSIAEMNLRCLAKLNLADSTDIPDGIAPAHHPSPSPSSHFTLADLISNERTFSNNIEALYKLGIGNGEYCQPTNLKNRINSQQICISFRYESITFG